MSRHREMENPAAVVRQDQEYVQHLEANGRHREEVDRDHPLQMILQERSPRLRRWFRSTHHVLAHAGFIECRNDRPDSAPRWPASPLRTHGSVMLCQRTHFWRTTPAHPAVSSPLKFIV